MYKFSKRRSFKSVLDSAIAKPSFYESKSKCISEIKKQVSDFQDVLEYLQGQKDLYAHFVVNHGSSKKRYGSIGKIKNISLGKAYKEKLQNLLDKIENEDVIINDYSRKGYWNRSFKGVVYSFVEPGFYFDRNNLITKSIEVLEDILSNIKVSIDFGNGKSSNVAISNIAIDNTPETLIYEDHDPAPVKKKTLIDRFGNEMSVGDPVVYYTNGLYGDTNLYIGNISSISKSNTIYCKNVKFKDSDYVSEVRIKGQNNIFKLTDDIKEQIMLLKLMF